MTSVSGEIFLILGNAIFALFCCKQIQEKTRPAHDIRTTLYRRWCRIITL